MATSAAVTMETISEIGAVTDSVTSTAATDGDKKHVADAEFDKEIRILVLYVEVVVGALGGAGVFLWLWYNRRRKSRVNQLIMHVALSDLCVVFGACLPQLVWEYDRRWRGGEVGCRLLKFVQSFSMMASNNMLVVLSLDRLRAIRWPLRSPIPVWKMTLVAWVVAGLLSVPQVAVFHTNVVDDPKSQYYEWLLCESIWRDRPQYERQIYLTFIGIVVFDIPLASIITCYVSIFLKIMRKAEESSGPAGGTGCGASAKPGKIYLQSTASSSLNRAKVKTLKMTIVIVSVFIICGLPYHVLEGIYNFGNHEIVHPVVSAIIGGMAVANSAVNPYIFLIFNANYKCLQGVLHCYRTGDHRRRNRGNYESTGVVVSHTEFTTATVGGAASRSECGAQPVVAANGAGKDRSAAKYSHSDSSHMGNSAASTEYVKLSTMRQKEDSKKNYQLLQSAGDQD